VRDGAATIHQHAHRPPDVVTQLRELAGELVGDQAIRGKVAAVEALERADLARLQALGVAEDADGVRLLEEGPGRGCPKRRNATGSPEAKGTRAA
jgi:hypothetical protein